MAHCAVFEQNQKRVLHWKIRVQLQNELQKKDLIMGTDTFDKRDLNSYLPHQQRVLTEKEELDEKIEKLYEFVVSDKFTSVVKNVQEQILLFQQLTAMQSYSKILKARIQFF